MFFKRKPPDVSVLIIERKGFRPANLDFTHISICDNPFCEDLIKNYLSLAVFGTWINNIVFPLASIRNTNAISIYS